MRKDPPLNTEVDDPVVIWGHAYLRVTPNSVHTIAYLQVAVLTYKLGL